MKLEQSPRDGGNAKSRGLSCSDSSQPDQSEEHAPSRNTKIDRIVEKYEIAEVREELRVRWTAEDNRDSLRDLEVYFNQRVLRAAIEEERSAPLDGEIENLYRLLTADDVRESDKTRAQRRLKRKGIDVDELRSDFVSHQTIYRYLKNHLNLDSPDKSETTKQNYIERVRALQNRTKVITKDVVNQIQEKSGDEDDIDVLVDVKVRCPGCEQYRRLEHFAEGAC